MTVTLRLLEMQLHLEILVVISHRLALIFRLLADLLQQRRCHGELLEKTLMMTCRLLGRPPRQLQLGRGLTLMATYRHREGDRLLLPKPPGMTLTLTCLHPAAAKRRRRSSSRQMLIFHLLGRKVDLSDSDMTPMLTCHRLGRAAALLAVVPGSDTTPMLIYLLREEARQLQR